MGASHAASYRALSDRVRVKTVCARSAARGRELAESLGAEFVGDLDRAISGPGIDAVDICLPTYLHREAAEKAFGAGRDVFLEKPIALNMTDADAIVGAAEASGRILMVGLALRFWPEYVELHRLVAAGELGRPRLVSVHRLSPPANWNEWMANEAMSGGVAVDLLVHDLDQVNWLLGRPLRAFARSPAPRHLVAMVEYEGGSWGFAEAGMAMPNSYPFSSYIRVLCEGGSAEYSFAAAPAEGKGNLGAAQSAPGLWVYPSDGGARLVPVQPADPWGPEIAYFIGCVERRQRPAQGTGEQARAALLASLAVNRSRDSGALEAV